MRCNYQSSLQILKQNLFQSIVRSSKRLEKALTYMNRPLGVISELLSTKKAQFENWAFPK